MRTRICVALLILAAVSPLGNAADQWQALRRAIQDLSKTYPGKYAPRGEFVRKLDRLEAARRSGTTPQIQQEFIALQREALMANPLLDFNRLLLVKRNANKLGLPQNWEGNQSIKPGDYDNEIDVLSPLRPDAEMKRLFRPADGGFAGDLELHYDAARLMFSMRADPKGPFRIFEINTDGSGLHQIPQIDEPDVHNYRGLYLPNGNLLFTSTAPFVGVPCVTGASHVANIYSLDTRTTKIRRLTFEQEHDWCPTVLNDGRILYLRWEYSDLPHFVARILFQMNPDGTGQMEHYGSNSYWPNSTFYARPVPNHPTRFVGIVGGHHGVPRMGELVLFDSAKGRHENSGVVQRIPGFGQKVEPTIKDQLVDESWPKFLHPYPLSDKYFLVSAKLNPLSDWGVYLVDVFDNMVLIKSEPGYALLEPIPLRKIKRQPVVMDRVDLARKDGLVVLQDIYSGPGLKGVPRGTVKQLRLFTYHFSYHGMGGQVNRVGLDGPWDIKRVMGTVPVEPDGSAYFRVPANTPISVQPLDEEGKAIQWMRSWLTAMPGETVSCVGCHDRQNSTPALRQSIALSRAPSEIKPWYGPTRGFAFKREVQPVLNRYCVSCHDEFRALPEVYPDVTDKTYRMGSAFTPSYMALRRFLRPATQEPDMHLLPPYEFHADTAKLVDLLRKGHHGVKLDAESWDRIITWIDLNAPAHGTWTEIVGPAKTNLQRERRKEMQKRYAGLDEDPEQIIETAALRNSGTDTDSRLRNRLSVPAIAPSAPTPVSAIAPSAPTPVPAIAPSAASPVLTKQRTLDLGNGLALRLQYIPPGEFIMGDNAGLPDERPSRKVAVDHGLWMGKFEISNEQYAAFDPSHDSFIERSNFLHFSDEARGDRVNGPKQPVCRISWQKAMAFCDWLSRKTGERFRLPTEAEWEYAARAGSQTPIWYGAIDRDFSDSANLADYSLQFFPEAIKYIPAWRPAVVSVNDGYKVSAPVGSFKPNAWGLHDMAGNVAEWTLGEDAGRKIARGGSWFDRPEYARSAFRKAYHPWQGVFDVGFRVVSDGPVKPEPAHANR